MPVSNPGSPAESNGERAKLEAKYERVVSPEVERFMSTVLSATLAGTLTIVTVNNAWTDLIDRVDRKVQSPSLTASLRESGIPSLAFTSAQFYLDRARTLNMTQAETGWLVGTALGFSDDPFPGLGGEPGRIVTPDETESWDKGAEGMARGASTGDHAVLMIDQLRAEGYPFKRWYNMHDSRVRPSHQHADRQTVRLDEMFAVGNSHLRYPGDPTGPPDEVYGCRCVVAGTRTQTAWG